MNNNIYKILVIVKIHKFLKKNNRYQIKEKKQFF